jgi:hypothetical protein
MPGKCLVLHYLATVLGFLWYLVLRYLAIFWCCTTWRLSWGSSGTWCCDTWQFFGAALPGDCPGVPLGPGADLLWYVHAVVHSLKNRKKMYGSQIPESSISLRFLCIILRVLRREVSVWISKIIWKGIWFSIRVFLLSPLQ